MTEIAIADFKKIDLRVAKVIDVEEISGADRVWKLCVDLGTCKKIIVAGIKTQYTKDSLIGKFVVVVNNLAPTVIRGVESQGMLLAAKDEAGLSVLVLDRDTAPGSIVG